MRLPLVLCLILLAACASHRVSTVDAKLLIPVAAERVTLERNEVFMMPAEISAPMPDYPDLASPPERIVICAEVVISEDGEVTSAVPIRAGGDCEQPGSQRGRPFELAVVAELANWSFIAGGICAYRESESECDSASASITAVPVKLAFEFQFSNRAGRRTVESSER